MVTPNHEINICKNANISQLPIIILFSTELLTSLFHLLIVILEIHSVQRLRFGNDMYRDMEQKSLRMLSCCPTWRSKDGGRMSPDGPHTLQGVLGDMAGRDMQWAALLGQVSAPGSRPSTACTQSDQFGLISGSIKSRMLAPGYITGLVSKWFVLAHSFYLFLFLLVLWWLHPSS